MGSGAASDTAPAAVAAPPAASSAPATGAGAIHLPTKLTGFAGFKRNNPRSDRFGVHRFHHIEFWCADATNTYKR